jgi:DnaA-homolog protein
MYLEQLPLSIQLVPEHTFAEFVVGDNDELLACLQSLPNPSYPYIYLWGEPGVGCSHLLQAVCHQFIAQHKSTFYLPLTAAYPVSIVQGLENVDCLCIDKINLVKDSLAWQEALFHLFNKVSVTNHHLLIAGTCPPAQLDLPLKDLQSRLSSGLILQVKGLSDTDKEAALLLHATQRGMPLRADVARFILHHAARNMSSLTTILAQLDEASLSSQRRITIPFVKAVMNW